MEASKEVILYNFQRSSPSWRVRLALSFKNIVYKYVAVPLNNAKILNEDHLTTLKTVNPYTKVPTLFIDDIHISESVAIIEYLDETRTHEPKFLPSDPK